MQQTLSKNCKYSDGCGGRGRLTDKQTLQRLIEEDVQHVEFLNLVKDGFEYLATFFKMSKVKSVYFLETDIKDKYMQAIFNVIDDSALEEITFDCEDFTNTTYELMVYKIVDSNIKQIEFAYTDVPASIKLQFEDAILKRRELGREELKIIYNRKEE